MKVRTWRQIHRFLGLVIGVQLLMWTLSGLVFSWNTIKAVRGEHLVRAQKDIDLIDFEIKNINEIMRSGEADEFDNHRLVSVTTRTMLKRPVYEFAFDQEGTTAFALFDAVSGKRVSPIDEDTAGKIALNDFAEDVDIRSVKLVENVGSHSEYRGKEMPAYRVVLEHSSDTAIYVSANRGVVTTRRNNQWRRFDFFWMLHTMDYQGRDNFNSWLLKGMSVFGLVTVLSGFVLGFKTSRFLRRRKNRDSS